MVGGLAEHYHWEPGFWRALGWRELQAWLRRTNEAIRRRRDGAITDPDSWAGRAADPWWDEQRRKARGE